MSTSRTSEEVPFGALGPKAAARAEGHVRALQPDLVILPLGTFTFTATFTYLRVRRALGARAARVYKCAEDGFDARTRGRGRHSFNRLARRVVRATLGAEPMASAAVAAAYRAVFTALARVEDVQVLVAAYPPESAAVLKGGLARQRELFVAEMEHAARGHHFVWANGQEALRTAPQNTPLLTPDGVHFSQEGHRCHAEIVLAAILGAKVPGGAAQLI